MKYILILSLLLTGCATYTVNGVEPGENQTLKVIGGIVVAGIIAKSLAKSDAKNCTAYTRDNTGRTISTTQMPC